MRSACGLSWEAGQQHRYVLDITAHRLTYHSTRPKPFGEDEVHYSAVGRDRFVEIGFRFGSALDPDGGSALRLPL